MDIRNFFQKQNDQGLAQPGTTIQKRVKASSPRSKPPVEKKHKAESKEPVPHNNESLKSGATSTVPTEGEPQALPELAPTREPIAAAPPSAEPSNVASEPPIETVSGTTGNVASEPPIETVSASEDASSKKRKVPDQAIKPVTTPADEEGLTPYELQRLQHIKRNQEYLRMLGLNTIVQEIKESAPKPKAKRRAGATDATAENADAPRRSGRLTAQKPEFEVDDDIDLVGEAKVRVRLGKQLEEQRAENIRAAIEDSQRWLKGIENWEVYTVSRLSKPPPPSPLDLLQEYYAHDSWRLLCCCVLMGRVASWDIKHQATSGFFELCPTPSAFLDTNPDEAYKVMQPLGLFPNRMKSLVAVSTRFLEMPEFMLGLDKELKIFGIGEFSYKSFRIFTRADYKCNPSDPTLKSFVNWQLKRLKKIEAGGDDADDVSSTEGSSSES